MGTAHMELLVPKFNCAEQPQTRKLPIIIAVSEKYFSTGNATNDTINPTK